MKIKKFGKIFEIIQWKGEYLGKVLALDTETEKITDPSIVPKQVMATAYSGTGYAFIITNQKTLAFLEMHRLSTFVFHTFAFDKVVTTKETGFLWWNLIENNQIIDIAILYKSWVIATKGYSPEKFSLDFIVSQVLKNVLPKDDSIRLTFGQFLRSDGTVDYASVSKAHYIYAALDPIATFMCYQLLMKEVRTLPTTTNLAHTIHLMGDVALKDITRRGIAVDLEYVRVLRDKYTIPMEQEAEILSTYGWVRGEKGLLQRYGEICNYLNINVPMTKRGLSMKQEDLAPYKNIPFVKSLLNYLDLEKSSQFLNELHDNRIHPYYDSLKVTGRSSCKKPNMQNLPRIPGVRQCFVPKDGCIFADSDYSSIEMFTAACVFKQKGWGTAMYDLLNSGKDPHIFAASKIHSTTEEAITKDQRQGAKPANYGFLANMSENTFIPYAANYGVDLDFLGAKKVKAGWIKAYPEVEQFWNAPYKAGGTFISDTGFIRGNCAYTEWLNIHFQGKAAEGAKIALYLNYKEGLPQVAFIHDEIMTEPEKSSAEDILKIQNDNMIKGMKMVCPMNIQVDGELKERFGK